MLNLHEHHGQFGIPDLIFNLHKPPVSAECAGSFAIAPCATLLPPLVGEGVGGMRGSGMLVISITRPSADVTPGKMDLDGNKIPGGVPGIPFTVKYCCWLPDQDSNLEPTD